MPKVFRASRNAQVQYVQRKSDTSLEPPWLEWVGAVFLFNYLLIIYLLDLLNYINLFETRYTVLDFIIIYF